MKYIKRVVFFVGKWMGGFALARRLTKSYLRILCFHGFELENETSFRPKLFIKKDTFQRRLATLQSENYLVLPLGEAIDHLKKDSLPPNAVVLTIDDGFCGVFSCAAPILKEYRYPATVYITTYYSQKEAPIFRLVVQYLFWSTRLNQVESMELLGLDLSEINLTDPDEKEQAEWAIIKYGETQCTELERQELCRKLAAIFQLEYSFIEKSRILSLLNSSEISQLNEDGFDVQMHTHRHQFPDDNEALAKKEIQENREVLERLVNRPLRHFCYPSGIWAPHQGPWLSELGVESATTCEVGFNDQTTNPLALKRFLDGENITQLEFEAEISGFAELLRRLWAGTPV